MKEKVIIAAVAQNGIIGREGRIPWYIPDDLVRFKKLTMGNSLIMGRMTYQSLPPTGLPGRKMVIVSGNGFQIEKSKGYVCHSIPEAISLAETLKGDKIFFAGGSEIYREAFKLADRLFLTQIHEDFVGDRVFQGFDETIWQEVSRDDYMNRIIPFSFVEYVRKEPLLYAGK
jgi:dihydrofolate reductase